MDFSRVATSELGSIKFLINSIANRFYFSAKAARASLLFYERNGLNFSQVSTYHDFVKKTEALPKSCGNRKLLLALRQTVARALSFRRFSRGTTSVAILVTDGGTVPPVEEYWKDILKESRKLREAGVRVLIIGVRGPTVRRKLRLLVQKDSDILLSRSFEKLSLKLPSIVENVCMKAGK